MSKTYKGRLLQLHTKLDILEANGDAIGFAHTASNVAKLYEKIGDTADAIEWYAKCLEKLKPSANHIEQFTLLCKLGKLHLISRLFDLSLSFFKQAAKIANTKRDRIAALIEISNALNWINSPDSLQKAEKLSNEILLEKNVSKESQSRALYCLAIISRKREEHNKSLVFFEKALKLLPLKQTKRRCDMLRSLAMLLIYNFDNNTKAIELLKEAEALLGDSSLPVLKQNTYQLMSEAYKRLGNYQLALDYHKAMVEAEKKVSEEKVRFKLISMEVNSTLIQIQKDKDALTLLNNELASKNRIIEEKNKNITESITYAERIQQAKLPHLEDIRKVIPNSFILFKPKDIVSGDFYFFHYENQTIIIASADCTGHGVPGALMSMICSEKLDDAVSQSKNPSKILGLLNKGVKASLRQTDEWGSMRDGMDIALCSIDLASGVVRYAGANRPFWLIRNGAIELEETKANKMAIGGYTEGEQHFDTHEFQLNEGDTFYICSDGYADTFNGKIGKKLTTKRFKQLVIEIQPLSMADQGKALDAYIEEWKSGEEQIDDILVIGVRL